jgi:hypothetical protein
MMNIETIKAALVGKSYDQALPVLEADIEKFEIEMGLQFGKQYRAFLKEFGALSVAYIEFYGICGNNDAIPSAIHATKMNRKYSAAFPRDVMVVMDRGDGVSYVINQSDHVYLYENEVLKALNISFFDLTIQKISDLD